MKYIRLHLVVVFVVRGAKTLHSRFGSEKNFNIVFSQGTLDLLISFIEKFYSYMSGTERSKGYKLGG